MRNTLSFVVAVFLFPAFLLTPAKGVSSSSGSVYAPTLAGSAMTDPPTLLLTNATDHQLISTNGLETRQPVGPENSVVEAIPTPTAFHAGGALLLLIIISRFIRKPRWI